MSVLLAFIAALGLSTAEHQRYHKYYKVQFDSAKEQAWAECLDGSVACSMVYEIERADRMAWIKKRNRNRRFK